MTASFNYSICYPDRKEIFYPNKIIDKDEVLIFARSYPWEEELRKLHELPEGKIHYSPSLDFVNRENQFSFCLSAIGDPNDYIFSAWYNRLILYKPFWGLFKEREVMDVTSKEMSADDAYRLLKEFVNGNYQLIEEKFRKR
ncbi:MAG: hypothetical protein AAGI38_24625 [Bacteroidota bacterium]